MVIVEAVQPPSTAPVDPSPTSHGKSIPSCGVGELLRRLLQIGAVLPPDTHQCLPVALGPQQVSTVTGTQEGTKGMDRGHPKISSVLRPLGLDQHAPHCLMTRMTRAG